MIALATFQEPSTQSHVARVTILGSADMGQVHHPSKSFRQACLNKARWHLSLWGRLRRERGLGARSRDGETGVDSGYNFRVQPISVEDRIAVEVCGKRQNRGQPLTALIHYFIRLPTSLCLTLAFIKQASAY